MLNKISKNDIKDYKAKDLMIKDVVKLLPRDDLLNARNKMSRYRIKKIVVVDDKNKRHPVGILSIKDIIKFLIRRALVNFKLIKIRSKNRLTRYRYWEQY